MYVLVLMTHISYKYIVCINACIPYTISFYGYLHFKCSICKYVYTYIYKIFLFYIAVFMCVSVYMCVFRI